MAYFPWLCQITQGIPTILGSPGPKSRSREALAFFGASSFAVDENLCINTSGVRKSQRFGKCLDSIPSGKLTLCY